jgi:hypothetical protein
LVCIVLRDIPPMDDIGSTNKLPFRTKITQDRKISSRCNTKQRRLCHNILTPSSVWPPTIRRHCHATARDQTTGSTGHSSDEQHRCPGENHDMLRIMLSWAHLARLLSPWMAQENSPTFGMWMDTINSNWPSRYQRLHQMHQAIPIQTSPNVTWLHYGRHLWM